MFAQFFILNKYADILHLTLPCLWELKVYFAQHKSHLLQGSTPHNVLH